MRYTFRVQPKEIRVVGNHDPSRVGGVGKVLAIFGSFEAGVSRGCHVNASMAEGVRESR